MGRAFGMILAGAAVLLLVGASSAQMGGGMSGGMGGGMMGGGSMGGGMTGGGHMGSGMMGGDTGKGSAPEITAEQAQRAAVEYASQYLAGFTVTRTVPLTGMHMTMYQAELSGPGDETRTLHINPWGNVMPFGGSATR